MKNSTKALLAIVISPILLPIINPSLDLGALGILLGFWGTFVAPILLAAVVMYLLFKDKIKK